MKAAFGPGITFAGYRIESLVGRGGMGVVYRATDLSLERPVALKMTAPELAEDEHFRSRFLREPRLAASLDHPNVIPIYEAGERRRPALSGDALRGGQRPEEGGRAGGQAGARAGGAGSGGRCARCRASAGACAPGCEACERAPGRGRPRVSDRLRDHEAGGRRLDGHRPCGWHARLSRSGTDPWRGRRRAHG
jgi:Protein kinase domain